jgi:hypothetical protein
MSFSFGNKNNFDGVRSGEYGVCNISVVSCFTKQSPLSGDECAGMLLWCRIHFCFSNNGSYSFAACRRRFITAR